MREVAVVMRRELRSYFLSPIAYVFGALFLALALWRGIGAIKHDARASTEALLIGFPLTFAIFLPLLTMRLWSEERKYGTLELLLTFPVTIGQLISGKFFAAVAFLALLLVMTLGLPLTLDHYGELDWGPVIGGYVATLLLAASDVSVGMFFSSLTRDQIVAGLLSIVALGFLFALALPPVASWLEAIGLPDLAISAIAGLSPFGYFVSISRGVFDTRDIVFYVAFCGFFLYANALVLRRGRQRG